LGDVWLYATGGDEHSDTSSVASFPQAKQTEGSRSPIVRINTGFFIAPLPSLPHFRGIRSFGPTNKNKPFPTDLIGCHITVSSS